MESKTPRAEGKMVIAEFPNLKVIKGLLDDGFNAHQGHFVSAEGLKLEIEKLPKVIRYNDWSEDEWSAKEHIIGGKTGREFIETHTARLLGVQEIVREPVKVEFKLDCTVFDPEVAFDNSRWGAPRYKVNQLKNKKWKITAEEIKE